MLRAATIPDPGALRPVSSDVAVRSEVHITQFQYTIVNLGWANQERQKEDLKSVFSDRVDDSGGYITSSGFVAADEEEQASCAQCILTQILVDAALTCGVAQGEFSFYRHPTLAGRSVAADYSYEREGKAPWSSWATYGALKAAM